MKTKKSNQTKLLVEEFDKRTLEVNVGIHTYQLSDLED